MFYLKIYAPLHPLLPFDVACDIVQKTKRSRKRTKEPFRKAFTETHQRNNLSGVVVQLGRMRAWGDLFFWKEKLNQKKYPEMRVVGSSKAPFSLAREKPARKRELFCGCMKVSPIPFNLFLERKSLTKKNKRAFADKNLLRCSTKEI